MDGVLKSVDDVHHDPEFVASFVDGVRAVFQSWAIVSPPLSYGVG